MIWEQTYKERGKAGRIVRLHIREWKRLTSREKELSWAKILHELDQIQDIQE